MLSWGATRHALTPHLGSPAMSHPECQYRLTGSAGKLKGNGQAAAEVGHGILRMLLAHMACAVKHPPH